MSSTRNHPRWAAWIGTLGVVLVAAPVIGLTGVAWVWRATEPEWLLPTCLAIELALVIGVIWFGRRLVQRAAVATVRLRGGPLLLLFAPLVVAFALGQPLPESPAPAGRVAIVGGGTTGLHTAWMLERLGVDYTLFEASERVGGHAFTHEFRDADGDTLPVDMGFVFGAPSAYPELKALMAFYGVERESATLDLSVQVGDVAWTTGGELPDDIERFRALAEVHWDDEALNLVPFGHWLDEHGFDQAFRDEYLTPFTIILFANEKGLYKVSTRFMLSMIEGTRRWLSFETGGDVWTVAGGSAQYYDVLERELTGPIRLNTPVSRVERVNGRIRLTAVGPDGPIQEVFDSVVLAVSADVARQLLSDRSWFEDFVLAQVRYTDHEVMLHTDLSAVPEDEALRRNYNYRIADGSADRSKWELSALPALAMPGRFDPVPVGTLNPQREYEGVQFRRTWHHFPMDMWHLANVLELLPRIQGAGGVYYAGDWVTFVGHGPAMRTGINAACRIGGTRAEPGLSTSPCFNATLVDPLEGIEPEHVELCGEQALFDKLVELACADVEPVSRAATDTPRGEVPLTLETTAADDVESRYQRYCHACHGTGAAEAPLTRDEDAWARRGPLDDLVASARRGRLAMPPMGGCTTCTEEQLRELVEYLIGH